MRQQRIFLSPPHLGKMERHFVDQAFLSNYIAPLGPMVDAFERKFSEYTGIKYCVAVSSGTAAMHLALRHLNILSGDEIFASTLTFIGSVSPIIFEGAVPIFIDCDRESWCMDPDLLEAELKHCARKGILPRAIIPTDLYGQCSNYSRIYQICNDFAIPVIVDAAEALGAKFFMPIMNSKSKKIVHAGKGARATVFSFNGNKVITTSGGGMLATDDKELAEHARFLSQQAREPYAHYEHIEVGFNYRMSNILAAIGLGQLTVLNDRLERKRKIFNYYKNELDDLPGIEFMPEAAYGKANRWLTVVLINPAQFGVDREQVRLALEAKNIESRPVWKPMHLQPAFTCSRIALPKERKQYYARAVGGDIAKDLFERGLCLPSGTAMTNADIDRVVNVIRRLAR